MKALLIAECREGKVLGSAYELIDFASKIGADGSVFLVGGTSDLPAFDGDVYLADASVYGEYNPAVHKELILSVVNELQPELIVFSHSSYGWDLAPRVAYSLKAAQVSEVVDIEDGVPVVPICNSKLRRQVQANTPVTVMTLQAGAFGTSDTPSGTPTVKEINTDSTGTVSFEGYEAAEQDGVDLSKSEVIVSAGRGVGKPDNVSMIADLAAALGGDYGASRPVVDAEWVEHNRQVGTTGQTVSPKLYVACGISGAIQHLAGMKKSEFVVAINTDKDAPIGEIADVLVVADLKLFVPVLTEKLKG